MKAEKTRWSRKKFQGQGNENFDGHDCSSGLKRSGEEDNSLRQAGLRAPSGKRPA